MKTAQGMNKHIQAVLDRKHESFDQAVRWVWFHCMSARDKAGFAQFLIDTDHPSIYQAGSQENRFRRVAREAWDFWKVEDRR